MNHGFKDIETGRIVRHNGTRWVYTGVAGMDQPVFPVLIPELRHVDGRDYEKYAPAVPHVDRRNPQELIEGLLSQAVADAYRSLALSLRITRRLTWSEACEHLSEQDREANRLQVIAETLQVLGLGQEEITFYLSRACCKAWEYLLDVIWDIQRKEAAMAAMAPPSPNYI